MMALVEKVQRMNSRPLFIPVILGTVRKGRASENIAKFVFEQVKQSEGVETELIDIRELKFPGDDAGEQIKDARFSETCERADGLVLVVPEYNHGYPGMLKHVLDSNLKEYIHKAVGICGVSAGGFGGTRVIQSCCQCCANSGSSRFSGMETFQVRRVSLTKLET